MSYISFNSGPNPYLFYKLTFYLGRQGRQGRPLFLPCGQNDGD